MDTKVIAQAVAQAFAEKYYQLFDASVQDLGNMYEEDSTLTFEGKMFVGNERILDKLRSLPFQQCHHRIETVDGQPSRPAGSVFVLVNGVLNFIRLDGVRQAIHFVESFHLMPTPEGGFYISNAVFRMGQAAP